jgi:hypothetical protein
MDGGCWSIRAGDDRHGRGRAESQRLLYLCAASCQQPLLLPASWVGRHAGLPVEVSPHLVAVLVDIGRAFVLDVVGVLALLVVGPRLKVEMILQPAIDTVDFAVPGSTLFGAPTVLIR